jgi:hypothetical protein
MHYCNSFLNNISSSVWSKIQQQSLSRILASFRPNLFQLIGKLLIRHFDVAHEGLCVLII